MAEQDFLDETAAAVHDEVRNLLNQAYRRGKQALTENRSAG
jgi:cell division protease FtsH